MSERGGGLPGRPAQLPGVPENAVIHELSQFKTLNVKVPRPSIGDHDMAWCENMMPVDNMYLRALWDKGPNLYSPPVPVPKTAVSLGAPTGLDWCWGRIVFDTQPDPRPADGPPAVLSSGSTTTALMPPANSYVVVWASAENRAADGVPSIIDVSLPGLSFHRARPAFTGPVSGFFGTTEIDIEYWGAVSTGAVSGLVSVQYDRPVRSAIFGAFAVSIAGGVPLNPWDAAGRFSNANTSGTPPFPNTVNVPNVSTVTAPDFAFAFFVNYNNPTMQPDVLTGLGSPFVYFPARAAMFASILSGGSNVYGSWNSAVGYYTIATNPLSGVNFIVPDPGGVASWVGIVDAVN